MAVNSSRGRSSSRGRRDSVPAPQSGIGRVPIGRVASVLALTVAFALTPMNPAGAAARKRQKESRKPPVQVRTAAPTSRPDTVKWLKEKIDLYAGWSGTSQDASKGKVSHTWSYQLVSLKDDVLELQVKGFMESRGFPPTADTLLIREKVGLRDLQPEPVFGIDPFAQECGHSGFAVQFRTRGDQPLIRSERVDPDAPDVEHRAEFRIIFSDRDIASRVGKALSFLIKTAKGKREPF